MRPRPNWTAWRRRGGIIRFEDGSCFLKETNNFARCIFGTPYWQRDARVADKRRVGRSSLLILFTTATLAIVPMQAGATDAAVDFGEALLGHQTKTKLYRVSNSGVRNLTVFSIRAQDVDKNFRVGSIYQGSSFQGRTWVVGKAPWTVPTDGTGDLFFFLNYGPFGKIKGGDTRVDTATLLLQTDSGEQTILLQGRAKKDSRATLSLYIEDENRFLSGDSGPDHRIVTEGETTRHLFLAREGRFNFRQDGAERAVYLFHDGVSAGVDDLWILGVSMTPDSEMKFTFTPDPNPEISACLEALPESQIPCAILKPAGNENRIKLGTMTFQAVTGGQPKVHERQVQVKALSRPVFGEGTPPLIGGSGEQPGSLADFSLLGANGAPHGTFGLKVHRLIAGFNKKINDGSQPSLIVSTATKGIVSRFANPAYPAGDWGEVFTIQDGVILDAITGRAVLKKIVTPVDLGTPAFPRNVPGLRLFNAPGSNTKGLDDEYYVECAAHGLSCAFFYLYLGDWAGSTSAECNGKKPVLSQPASQGVSAVLDPRDASDWACLQGPDGIQDETNGVYDPVTGEVTFQDVAVRLFAPGVPLLGNETLDATIRLSLTTGCVGADKVPDEAVKTSLLVSQKTLDDAEFDAGLMPSNPLLPYVDQVGTVCPPRSLHGRPLFTTDVSGTLDNGPDADGLNFGGFDLAGVGRNTTTFPSLPSTVMHIVIKAEIGDF